MSKAHWLRRWGPSIAGAIAIWFLSTQAFSDIQTGRVILPALAWLFPWMSPRTLVFCHKAIRKLAHVSVYFGFGVLLLQAIRGDRKGWHGTWAVAAFAIAVGYAVLDEFHQSFVPFRHPSARDVFLDACGAFAAQIVVWWHSQMREKE